MRNDKKTRKAVSAPNIAGYHCSETQWPEVLYFTSDRGVLLESVACPKGYGVELETECASINGDIAYAKVLKDIVFAGFPANMWRFERDGSLGDGEFKDCALLSYSGGMTRPVTSSAECVSGVMTRERMRNLYSQFEAMYRNFAAFNIRTGRPARREDPSSYKSVAGTGHCGMHVNISNGVFGPNPAKQAEAIRKFLYFFNNNDELICALVRRDSSRLTYCRPQGHDKDFYRTMELAPLRGFNDHYCATNLQHYRSGRIELRLVGGQATFAAFRCTMEVIFHVVDACKSLPWSAMDNLVEVFKGANVHVLSRLSLCVDEGVLSNDTYLAIEALGSGVRYDIHR